jgi:hypothetical protein
MITPKFIKKIDAKTRLFELFSLRGKKPPQGLGAGGI